jgi:hypothetical protein
MLGYRTFHCSACKRLFNERTGTAFNFLEYPIDVVLLVVLWRLRYKLSLRDLTEMFLERGREFSYETVREWKRRFAPLIAEQLRAKRRGKVVLQEVNRSARVGRKEHKRTHHARAASVHMASFPSGDHSDVVSVGTCALRSAPAISKR